MANAFDCLQRAAAKAPYCVVHGQTLTGEMDDGDRVYMAEINGPNRKDLLELKRANGVLIRHALQNLEPMKLAIESAVRSARTVEDSNNAMTISLGAYKNLVAALERVLSPVMECPACRGRKTMYASHLGTGYEEEIACLKCGAHGTIPYE